MTPKWFWRDLADGEQGRDVDAVQRLLLAPATGVYDEETRAYVRGVQMVHDQYPSGVVDQATAELIGESVASTLPPGWYRRVLKVGASGEDVATLNALLHLPDGDQFTTTTEQAVRRWQSAHGLPLTGRVNKSLAALL